MGSVVAILSRSEAPDVAVARRMLAASPHRGTLCDLRVCGNAILGVSRAADPVDAVISGEGSIIAAFSGSLDNAEDVGRRVATAGFPSASSSPADIVVSAFRAFGHDAPNYLRGAFAGIVTDGHQMWSFRDHVGLASLFYRDESKGFFVASEVKQIIAGAAIKREPNIEVLERIFYGRLLKTSPSALQGVDRAPHATTISVNGSGSATFHTYWHPRRVLETLRPASAEEVQERFDVVFQQAVGRCLTGDDIVSLSGGIDSPAVAGFAAPLFRQSTGRPLPALSLVFPNHPTVDERPYIESVTQHLGMALNTFQPSARIFDDLFNWCQILDGPVPFMSPPQMHEFYLEARRLGVRNILTGDIAECVVDLSRHVTGHLLTRGRWKALAQLLETQRQQGASLRRIRSWRKFGAQLGAPFVPGRLANWYLSLRGRDFPKRVPDWLDRRTVSEVPFRNDLLAPGLARWAQAQTIPLEGCTISMEGAEICAARAGVTVRRPFADVDLWEFFLSLPAEIKYPDLRSKTLIRRLLRGRIPDVILDRRDKTYFDDDVMSRIDYSVLRKFLVNPAIRVRGVDYERLAARLQRQDLNLIDVMWVNDLVRIHAFLSQW